MNTPNSQVPEIKLAKVGDKNHRRRGAGAVLYGSAGGSGASAVGVGMSLGKTLMLLAVVGGISGGAWQIGRMAAAGSDSAVRKDSPKRVFAENAPQHYDDLSGVIQSGDGKISNSLGYVSGSADGLTPEERAKKRAEEEAARKAQEEADKKTQEEANKQVATPDGAPDPNALVKDEKKLTPGKFGQLSSSFRNDKSNGLAGGGGLSGGMGRGFSNNDFGNLAKGQAGSVASYRNTSKARVSSAGKRSSVAQAHAKGFAKNQLLNAFALSKRAQATGKSESAAESAADAFEDNKGHGTVIDGPGLQTSAPTQLDDKPTTPPHPNQFVDQNGQIQHLADTGGHKHFKFQWMIDAVQAAMLAIAALTLAVMWEKHVLKGMAVGAAGAPAVVAHIKILLGIIAFLGVTIMSLGIALMAYTHDLITTGIIAVIGALIAVYASISLADIWGAQDFITHTEMQSVAAIPAVTGLLVSAGGYFAAQGIHAKQNMD